MENETLNEETSVISKEKSYFKGFLGAIIVALVVGFVTSITSFGGSTYIALGFFTFFLYNKFNGKLDIFGFLMCAMLITLTIFTATLIDYMSYKDIVIERLSMQMSGLTASPTYLMHSAIQRIFNEPYLLIPFIINTVVGVFMSVITLAFSFVIELNRIKKINQSKENI